jgi:rubrerythrin
MNTDELIRLLDERNIQVVTYVPSTKQLWMKCTVCGSRWYRWPPNRDEVCPCCDSLKGVKYTLKAG